MKRNIKKFQRYTCEKVAASCIKANAMVEYYANDKEKFSHSILFSSLATGASIAYSHGNKSLFSIHKVYFA